MRIGKWEIKPTRVSRDFGFSWREGISAPGLPTTSPPIDRSEEDLAHDARMEAEAAGIAAGSAAAADAASQRKEQAAAAGLARGPTAGALLAVDEDERAQRMLRQRPGYGQAARRTLLG